MVLLTLQVWNILSVIPLTNENYLYFKLYTFSHLKVSVELNNPLIRNLSRLIKCFQVKSFKYMSLFHLGVHFIAISKRFHFL